MHLARAASTQGLGLAVGFYCLQGTALSQEVEGGEYVVTKGFSEVTLLYSSIFCLLPSCRSYQQPNLWPA